MGLIHRIQSIMLTALLVVPAMALSVTYSASGVNAESGNALSASVEFIWSDLDSDTLTVVLTNTGVLTQTMVPSDILTAVFFDLSTDPDLTPTSATISLGSVVVNGSTPSDGVVGGEWAYHDGLSGLPQGSTAAIHSAGFGLPGQANFPGANLNPPPGAANLGGFDYGLVPINYQNGVTGNGGANGQPLIRNSATFVLNGLGDFDFDLGTIGHVSFQYGTSLSETNLPGTIPPPPITAVLPEPASMTLVGLGLAGLALRARRKL